MPSRIYANDLRLSPNERGEINMNKHDLELYRSLLRDRDFKIKVLEDAVSGIASWLAASLDDSCCEEYRDACEAVFACDPAISGRDK